MRFIYSLCGILANLMASDLCLKRLRTLKDIFGEFWLGPLFYGKLP